MELLTSPCCKQKELELVKPKSLRFDFKDGLFLVSAKCWVIIMTMLFWCATAQKITTIAGNGTLGFAGDGGLALNALLEEPRGLFVDSLGNIFFADRQNDRVRKVNSTNYINNFAGNGVAGDNGDGGLAINARLNRPSAVAVDASGNVFIADESNSRVRRVNTTGYIFAFAGTGSFGTTNDGGLALSAKLMSPRSLAVDLFGNVFIADRSAHRIRKVNSTGYITTVAGTSVGFAGDGGLATMAELNSPNGVFVDVVGNIFIADNLNNRIRKVDTTGYISTVAGKAGNSFSGDGGPATNAFLNRPNSVFVDITGTMYIADTTNHRIRKVDSTGIISTIVGSSVGYSGDGGLAVNAKLNSPVSVFLTPSGTLYIADFDNHCIRKVEDDTCTANVVGSACYVDQSCGKSRCSFT